MNNKNKVPVLLSYAYANDRVINFLSQKNVHEHLDIIIDSGAYTAFKSNKKIKISDYIKFITNIPFPVKFYFTLDSIGNSKVTLQNYILLEGEGLTPVPIYTRGDTERNFKFYYETRGFVGIGGIAGTPGCREHLCKLYNSGLLQDKKVHWLGYKQQDFLLHFKPDSCDSSAWRMSGRFASGQFIHNRKFYSFSKDNFKSLKLKQFCQKYSLDSNALGKEDSWRFIRSIPPLCTIIQLYSTLEYMLLLRQRFNITLYLAISGANIKELEIVMQHINNFWRLNNE